MDLRYLKLRSKLEKLLPNIELMNAYTNLTKELNYQFKLELTQTFKERTLLEKIQQVTKLRVERSVWIGQRNIELFIPALKGESFEGSKRRFNGLAIEVDGPIHDTEMKMRKDNSKYHYLHKAGIAVYTVENRDLNCPQVREFIQSLRKFNRLDARGRQRLRRNIYILTIAKHLEHPFINWHFKEEQKLIIKEIGDFLC